MSQCTWQVDGLDGNDLSRFYAYVAVATVLELLNVISMEYCYFRRVHLSVFKLSSFKLFTQRHFALNGAGVCTTLLINIIYLHETW